MKILFSLLTFVGVIFCSTSILSTTYYVNGTTGNDSYDGLSPTWDGTHGPKNTIQAGINTSVNTDTVIVADGTYKGTGNKDIRFGGKRITVRSENGSATCIIDCETHLRGFTFNSNETLESVIDGFTITNGLAANDGGGAIYFDYSAATIRNCILTSNRASGHGGAIYIFWSNPSIEDCIIKNNESGYGGGISCYQSNPIIKNCQIIGNSAFLPNESFPYGYGGGLRLSKSNATIKNCIIARNFALTNGGGIFCGENCSAHFDNCTISGNSTNSNGGGLGCESNANPVFTNCIFWDDLPQELDISTGTPSFTYCDIQGGYPGTGNINLDPKFGNPQFDDFHLMWNSPCIDAGYSDSMPETDIEDEPRWDNPTVVNSGGGTSLYYDIGVDEFVDHDVDTLPDYWEATYGLDPNDDGTTNPDNGASGDPDSDSLSNYLEYLERTNPVSADIDGDGRNDSVEITDRTNPYHPDNPAKTYYVNGTTGNDTYDGLAKEFDGTHGPKKTIQAGINASITGWSYKIEVADGLYRGDGNVNLDFEGREITVVSCNGAEAAIIDCEASRTNPRRGFYFHSGETLFSVLDGFTIINGFANDPTIGKYGGGIRITDSSPTISNCIITNCGAMLNGTGIEVDGNSSPLIFACKILYNYDSSMDSSGGISLWSTGQPTIENCTISYNVCGIRCGVSSPIIKNCIIKFNFETGVYLYRSNPSMSDCTIKANRGTDGGGIYYEWSSGTLTNCIINGNTSSGEGAGIYLWDRCHPQINACEISNNWSFESGGAVDCQADSNPVITNCIIRSNTAHNVGGAFAVSSLSSLTIANCTILDNTADKGGDWFYCSNSSLPNLVNCIIRGQTAQPVKLFESSPPNITYSNVEGGYSGIGNIDTNPKFKNVFLHDYSLLSDSPCIDAGTSNGAPLSDFRGELRYDYQNMPNSGGGSFPYYDMGAFEFVDHDGDGLPDFWEIENGLDPNDDGTGNPNNGSSGDPDSDSANNMAEYLSDSNPLDNDTDDDGRDDSQEILAATNPRHPDNPEKTYYVNTLTGNDSLNGLFPYPNGINGPKKTIQAGLDAAASGWDYIVLVADGTYKGEGNKNLDFKGKALKLKSENGCENTTIDCEFDGRAFSFEEAEKLDTIVDGFSVINGILQPTSPQFSTIAGALMCSNASPKIINCRFSNNKASLGGAIYLLLSQTEMVNCLIEENQAFSEGGGMYLSRSTAKITNCSISSNQATENAGYGGGIYLFYAEPTFLECNITSNNAFYGGGVKGLYSNLFISNSSITSNTATSGGAIYLEGNLTNSLGRISGCIITGNDADNNGGGIYFGNSAKLFNSLLVNNTAGNYGGALYCYNNPTITNCTITANSASAVGGGLYSSHNSHAALTNCILWNNQNGEIACEDSSSLPILNYCDILGGWQGTGNINANPLFYSGTFHNYYLSNMNAGQKMNSPCLNTGSDTAANLGLETFTTRTDNVPDAGIVDMGYHAEIYMLTVGSIIISGTDIIIHWNALPSKSYTVQCSTDMQTWNDVRVGETDNWTDVGGASASQKYYRIKQ